MARALTAPFTYYGGKSRAAALVWARLGDVPNYVEPFCGSCAVLLGRPDAHPWHKRLETVNDVDSFIVNFWRATQANPALVAQWCDHPVHESTMHARHLWLATHAPSLAPRLEADPAWYSAKVAGWWLWLICTYAGGAALLTGRGPWHVIHGTLQRDPTAPPPGVVRSLPHLLDKGRGILSEGRSPSANATLCADRYAHALSVIVALRHRLRRVRVCCGDWARVLPSTHLATIYPCGVFLDPPYSPSTGRFAQIYGTDRLSTTNPAAEAYAWALAHGDNPRYRIALCGYDTEHVFPSTWACISWKAKGGAAHYGHSTRRSNPSRERIWFSPHCLKP